MYEIKTYRSHFKKGEGKRENNGADELGYVVNIYGNVTKNPPYNYCILKIIFKKHSRLHRVNVTYSIFMILCLSK
jgi:hypothetical protein